MSPKIKRKTTISRSTSRQSIMGLLMLKGLPLGIRKLAYITLFAVIGVATVYVSRAETVAMTCPLKGKPAHSNNTDYNGGGFGAGRPNGRKHAGVDFGANSAGVTVGTPIFAPRSGTVSRGPDGGYGISADLTSGNYTFRFAHLSSIAKTGSVSEGELIAYSGETGAGPAHLHFEIRKNGAPINPGRSYSSCTPVGGSGSGAPSQTLSSSAPTSWNMTTCSRVTLDHRSSHPCVKVLQGFLKNVMGLENVPQTGIYDGRTADLVRFMQYNRSVPGSKCVLGAPTTWWTCDGKVGAATWAEFNKIVDLEEAGGGGALEDIIGAGRPIPAPQPGLPGQSGSSNCVGGCQAGQPGASNPGQPGASNPGKATQGSPGSPGAPGSQGASGTSGTSGSQGSKGSQGGVSIGGQSQGTSYSGSTKTSCKNGTCTTTTPDGKTTTTKASSSTDKPPAVAQYVIRSHASGRCMDADGTTRGKDTQIWDCTGNSNQKWGLATDGTIRLAASGLCLEVEGGKTRNGSDVQIYTCNGGSHQRWQWNSDGTIRSSATGKCLDVKDNDTANGTDLQIWDCFKGASNQRWGTW